MKLIFSLLAGCLFTASIGFAQSNSSSEYWPLDEFYQAFPQQVELSRNFEQLVQGESQPLTVEQDKEIRIFVVYPGHQVSDYWRRSIASFTARLDELNIHYQIYNHYTRPTVAVEQQQRLIEKAERYQPDYLIFTLDVSEHANLIAHVLEQKKMKLILQNITTPYKAWQANPPFMYVGFDHVEGTKLLHGYFTQHYPKAKYGLVYRSPGYVSEMRGDSFIRMQEAAGAQLVDSHYSDASKHGAAVATRDMLKKHPQVDFVYACSTDIAFGITAALARDSQFEGHKIAVNGWGGGDKELDAILSGELDVTVMRMNDDNGVAMAEAIKLDLQGRAKLIPQVFSGDFKLVDKRIHPAKLEEYKKRAFRYSSASQ
ncbi:substrate-binding domain-containing protein [Motilimonas sp. 1_MG-2023]|uniref:substrate-binding domain-containing protein n=1 Tax=Motilimonas sp. 1_MG-2023 TaxID=3062672 RepID=UPI0026E19F51|nr:substrate-binding domain-containing protein [Motilimonas sp. 1_MG-2023]MDO6526054.1 substrate-binding domain-containing protein [Motilimonas sp. 1_MG-2023]